jgi:signal transduction histidine kinase
MSDARVPSDSDREPPQPFSERLRKVLAHDARSPLGAIVNFASILEFYESADREEVRAVATRIRQSANRLVVMLQHMTDATMLSARPLRIVKVDLSVLLRSVLFDLGLHGRFPARGTEPSEAVGFDLELLTFAWRAFLSVHAGNPAISELDLDLEVSSDEATTTIALWMGVRPNAPAERLGFTRFTQGLSGHGATESCMALGFVESLIHERGGRIELWGRPPEGSAMFFTLPVSS